MKRSTTKAPRNYLSQREQRRLLVIVFVLGATIFMMNKVRQPGFVNALSRMLQGTAQMADAGASQGGSERIGLAPEDEADFFEERFPGIDEELLKAVEDDAPNFPKEAPAWFNILSVCRDTPQEDLESGSLGVVTYRQINQLSGEFRGRLVTVRGTLREVNRQDAPINDQGFESYYRIYITPEERPDDLVIAWCLEIPKGMPLDKAISVRSELTGFFYKRWVYTGAERQLEIAPTMLAKRLVALGPLPMQRQQEEAAEKLPSPWVVIAIGLGIGAVVVAYIYFKTRRPPPVESADVASIRPQESD